MKRILIPAAFAALCSAVFAGQTTTPLWLRNPAISPDGKSIAFTFKGDIYTVPTTGGDAHRLTAGGSYNTSPVWSPDGSRIAFTSNREGSPDIFIMPATGGTPRRLSSHSGSEHPLAFASDSTIIMTANIMPSPEAINGYVFNQLYTLPVSGARPSLLASFQALALSVGPDGKILYQDKKGYEDPLRKHERSSGTGDIWLASGLLTPGAKAYNATYTKLTDFIGHDINPVWRDADSFYYVSEKDGNLNVYQRSLAGGDEQQLTNLAKHPVRSLSASADGATLAFSYDGELYTLIPGQKPVKVNVAIATDDYTPESISVARKGGARSFAVSPDGSEVAFVVRGDVFVTSSKYGTTRQITSTPGQERSVVFAPDGRTLYYDSERDGRWQIFKAAPADTAQHNFTYATEIVETPVVTDSATNFMPRISHDGNRLAWLRNRTTLMVRDLKSGKTVKALDGKYAYSYTDGDVDMQWNPASSDWLLFNGYIGTGGWNNSDIAAVKADGSEVINLTESGYSDGNGRWTPDGRGVLFQSGKNGYRSHGSWGEETDVYVMWLDPEAYARFSLTKEERELADTQKPAPAKEAKKDTKKDAKARQGKNETKSFAPLDFANRKNRLRRLTPNSSFVGDYFLTPKLDKLYYVTSFEDDADLWAIDLLSREAKIVDKNWGYGPLVADSASQKLFTLSGGALKNIELESGKVTPIDFNAKSEFSADAERAYIFDHMKRLVADKFYDESLHGVDWEAYTRDYARFLPYINNKYDFAILLSEVLGELNASHTGGRAYDRNISPLVQTAYLGAFFDEEYAGPGFRISEVIARGPLALAAEKVAPGDIITAIDSRTIPTGADWVTYLQGKAGERTLLSMTRPDGSKYSVTVKPVSQGAHRTLLYKRWVDRNQAIVDSISGGKIAYVHITGMDSPSFREVYDQLLGKYRNCDAAIVDTRFNGGGWLHNDVALLLSGKKYVDFIPRGQYIGSEPFSQWTKPSAMLISECNYSDAHGTPYVYKTLGLGKLVGAPVPGTMTAVWWETQVDPDIVFGIPQVKSVDLQGKALENQQLNPDVLIYNLPADLMRGHDSQLEEAVKLLMKK